MESMIDEAWMHEFVEVSADHFEVALSWIFFIKVQIFQSQVIHIIYLLRIKKCRVLKNTFAWHDTVATCEFHCSFDVFESADATIDDDGDVQGLLNSFNHRPVCRSNRLFIMFFCSTMNCKKGGSSFLNLHCKLQSIFFFRKTSYFTCNRNLQILL